MWWWKGGKQNEGKKVFDHASAVVSTHVCGYEYVIVFFFFDIYLCGLSKAICPAVTEFRQTGTAV